MARFAAYLCMFLGDSDRGLIRFQRKLHCGLLRLTSVCAEWP